MNWAVILSSNGEVANIHLVNEASRTSDSQNAADAIDDDTGNFFCIGLIGLCLLVGYALLKRE